MTLLLIRDHPSERGVPPFGGDAVEPPPVVPGNPFARTVLALREAGRAMRNWRLTGCTLAVTLEPCTMCAAATVLARVDRLVFGAFDDKAGGVGGLWDVVRDPRLNHAVEVVGGVRQDECSALLSDFFRDRR